MDKAIYDVLKTCKLPIAMKTKIKLAKTEKELAFILFNYGYAEIVGEFYRPQDSQKYFEEWKKEIIGKIDEKLTHALGSATKFSNATEYKGKMFTKIEENKTLLIQGKIKRRQKSNNRKKAKE
jgi:hypothetical protein